ncbi:hypothetical protein [Shinella sp. DD12]|uniref:hypothetical protein n=1 Tax=Shinella sp. DD12 TaxID=1410620 RepID=UPI0003C53A32|nr:hypothetical protein [Shinella sp. DD12]EYR81909.1 hypothetical protein SHLA_4c002010 [Shinella sp. DD12]
MANLEGQEFPIAMIDYAGSRVSLRDYLASIAMPSLIAKVEGQATNEEELAGVINEVATVSYRIADAMLAARKAAA